MFTPNQKKVATGIGIGATALGTILLVWHHKKLPHQVSKKELLKKEAEAVNRNRRHLEHVLHLDPIIRRLKRESKPSRIVHYGNGVYCDNKTGKCCDDDIVGNTEHVIADGYKDVLKHFLGGGYR